MSHCIHSHTWYLSCKFGSLWENRTLNLGSTSCLNPEFRSQVWVYFHSYPDRRNSRRQHFSLQLGSFIDNYFSVTSVYKMLLKWFYLNIFICCCTLVLSQHVCLTRLHALQPMPLFWNTIGQRVSDSLFGANGPGDDEKCFPSLTNCLSWSLWSTFTLSQAHSARKASLEAGIILVKGHVYSIG